MKTSIEVDEYRRKIGQQVRALCLKKEHDNPPCYFCKRKGYIANKAFEACIPKAFWNLKPGDIKFNKGVFDEIIQKYTANMNIALQNGYGLTLSSDNGSGKSTFLCYILLEAIKRGRSVYYTTLPQLNYNLKRGFSDSQHSVRLERFLLTSDFLVIDEFGAEKNRNASEFLNSEITRVIKGRIENQLPVLIGTNLTIDALDQHYGMTLSSMLQLNQAVFLSPGDFRSVLSDEMRKDMGY